MPSKKVLLLRPIGFWPTFKILKTGGLSIHTTRIHPNSWLNGDDFDWQLFWTSWFIEAIELVCLCEPLLLDSWLIKSDIFTEFFGQRKNRRSGLNMDPLNVAMVFTIGDWRLNPQLSVQPETKGCTGKGGSHSCRVHCGGLGKRDGFHSLLGLNLIYFDGR